MSPLLNPPLCVCVMVVAYVVCGGVGMGHVSVVWCVLVVMWCDVVVYIVCMVKVVEWIYSSSISISIIIISSSSIAPPPPPSSTTTTITTTIPTTASTNFITGALVFPITQIITIIAAGIIACTPGCKH